MRLLHSMRRETFEPFLALAIETYASDSVAVGQWGSEEAAELARAETRSLLPDGIDTKGHFLFELIPEEVQTTVGYLWFSTLHRGVRTVAHVYLVHVLKGYRRRGYARAALLEAEHLARQSGHDCVTLNVFANNAGARALYESLGYETLRLNLAKDLP